MTSTTSRRNDPCPCGSGKKFKQCCDGKESKKAAARSKMIAVVAAGLILLGAFGFVRAVATSESTTQIGEHFGHDH